MKTTKLIIASCLGVASTLAYSAPANNNAPKSAYGTAQFKVCIENTGSTYSGDNEVSVDIIDTSVIGQEKEVLFGPIAAGEVKCSKTFKYDIYTNGEIVGYAGPYNQSATHFKIDFNGQGATNDWVGSGNFSLAVNRPAEFGEPSKLYNIEDEDTVYITTFIAMGN